jgi:hypothetical protein
VLTAGRSAQVLLPPFRSSLRSGPHSGRKHLATRSSMTRPHQHATRTVRPRRQRGRAGDALLRPLRRRLSLAGGDESEQRVVRSAGCRSRLKAVREDAFKTLGFEDDHVHPHLGGRCRSLSGPRRPPRRRAPVHPRGASCMPQPSGHIILHGGREARLEDDRGAFVRRDADAIWTRRRAVGATVSRCETSRGPWPGDYALGPRRIIIVQ